MKKKVLSILLAVCLLVGCLPLGASAAEATSGKCGDNVIWSYDTSTKTLTISGTGPMQDYDYWGPNWVDTPWNQFIKEIKAVTIQSGVTSIRSYAFYDGKYLTSVRIPDTVTSIGESAFCNCSGLTSIKIPNSVTDIGEHALSNCSSLTDLKIPNSVTRIEHWAFSGCTGLTSVTIGNGVTSIGQGTFSGCSGLTSVTIPDGMTSISGAFDDCTGLTSVTIPDSVTDITAAFSGCTSLTSITIPNGETDIGIYTFEDCISLTSITIPDNVTYIGPDAFSGCIGLTSIIIPNSVTMIDWYAFSGCTGLTSVTIPDNVTSIGDKAFKRCPNLTIYGVAGSYAETYAKENNIPFVAGLASSKPTKPTVAGFKDVFEGQYYAKAVKWAVENDITSGTSDTTFSPNAPCTRAQAVTFLWRAAGKPEPAGTGKTFIDVKANAYYEKAVQWAVEQGITSGTGNGKFSPDSTCTRAQIVTFLYRAENAPAVTGGNSFSDVSATAYYKNAVEWAAENEITSGTGSGNFSPENYCIRGQIVTFLYRYSNK